MKQYTNESQTAKLMELGFEMPKFEIETQLCNIKGQPLRAATIVGDYSIGELVEMLPEVTCRSNNDDVYYYLTIYNDAMDWNIAYRNGYDELCHIVADELIDALYNMVVKLKEKGVI